MGWLTKHGLKAAATDYAPMLFGIRVPGFIRLHIRYLFSNPFVYMVLVVAPFVIGLVMLLGVNREFLNNSLSGWQAFLITLFVIAMAFYFAERNRTFRTFYVRALPAMVILNGLFIYVLDAGITGSLFGGLVVFAVLALIPALILGKLSMGMGYRMLSNGADRRYRSGRDLYIAGDHEEGLLKLEPSAKRGHMKSLYLLGHAHEHGFGRSLDRVKAARFYDRASKKGYRKASDALDRLCASFTADEREVFESHLGPSGLNDLF